LKNVNVIAVANVSKKSQCFALNIGVKKVYGDYDKLLRDPEVDCVVISLPTSLHAEAAIKQQSMKNTCSLKNPCKGHMPSKIQKGVFEMI